MISFTLPAADNLGLSAPEYIVFLHIHQCQVLPDSNVGLDLAYYHTLGRHDMVDLTTAQCVIGRVNTRNDWAIIDRTGSLARSWYNETDDPTTV